MILSQINVATSPIFLVVAFAISGVSAIRWIRVAQREHYVPGYVFRFMLRWYFARDNAWNFSLSFVMILLLFATTSRPAVVSSSVFCFISVGILTLVLPLGLGIKGRTSPLKWTRRARLLFGVTLAINFVISVASYFFGLASSVGAVEMAIASLVVELGTWITAPLEERSIAPFVASATSKLNSINPKRVAITGSFGKTSTKVYLAQLCRESISTLASPASYNNRAGLARTVNENLLPGTDLFIAEMGTFGPGEIAALVEWVRPTVVAITAIGPVHLERFGSEENILKAKTEIAKYAEVVVLNVDDPRLMVLASELERQGKKIWRVSGVELARSVAVLTDDDGRNVVYHDQRRIGSTMTPVAKTNLAVAVAMALELGVTEAAIGSALTSLEPAKNRMNIAKLESGASVVDDTYNSNPSGARMALSQAATMLFAGSKLIVVTPGMVELGDRQYDENRLFGEEIASVATDLVIVGLTNKRALHRGALGEVQSGRSKVRITYQPTRDAAVKWIKANSTSGDVVLYENDLPDHYA
ncbi:UDP-N-acetylmuramoyl-tripeptide--D-alanyl-D-alanine ligase [Acidithrix sp. C25]|uniref:Mur ligase family protein n=1 Tax=Acidithrix sp. C25 TaxID=1671482 RepID=UPI00191BA58C|nr:UDP-N-acetylmuramoyl-tripeptide--D-alanyl-D-alanine ligase [Acidithrix sp. C25]CAG4903963.1 unnamed protein product [Acidithrix sp. C25]